MSDFKKVEEACGDALEGAIVTNVDICRNFPSLPSPKLPREQQFDVLGKTLQVHRVVVLEGEPLSGKTECLAEIMRRRPNECVGVFLNPDLGVFFSPAYLRLVVAEQISWMVDGERLKDEIVSDELYQRLLFRLQRHAKHKQITWLVDGLFVEGGGDVSSLLKLLPFGMKEFAFVITGDSDISDRLGLRHEKPKSVPIYPVGLEEAKSFFSGLGVDDSVIHELRSCSSANIGQMQKLRRFVRSGLSVEELLSEHKSGLEAIFEFEWRPLSGNEELRKITAYVVFSSRPAFVTDVAKFVDKSCDETRALIGGCRILAVSDQEIVSVESRAQRLFLKNRLASYEASVRSHVITSLLSSPGSKDTTQYLPVELLSAGRHDELINHLGPGHFLNLLETERSLHSIRVHAGLGIDAARASSNQTAELALSLIRSVATGLTFTIGFDSQIEALIKLGAVEQALELAAIAPTVEERLHVLSIAANTLHENGQIVSADLKEQIQVLKEELSFEDLGELGIEIACNLLPVDFDMATEVAHQVLDGARKKIEAVRDEQLSNEMGGLRSPSLASTGAEIKRSLELLSRNQARRFADAVASTVGRFSYDRILGFIKNIEPTNKIMVLARWLTKNQSHPKAFQVAELALDIVLGEVSRAPRLQDLREIAEVLPRLASTEERDALAKKIEAQANLLGHHGTSEEYCRLWLLIYRVRFESDPAQTELALIDLFGEIDALKEVAVQATCWTWMLFQLSKFPNLEKLEKDVPLVSEVSVRLGKAIDRMLEGTANHFNVARPAIAALAQTRFDEAERLVVRLNTEAHRDRGYQELVRNLGFAELDSSKLEVISRSVKAIVDDGVRNEVVLSLLEVLVRRVNSGLSVPVLPHIKDLWSCLRVSSARLQAHVQTTRIHLHENRVGLNLDKAREEQFHLWELVLVDSVRIELGFWVASEYATDNPDFSREWLAKSAEYAKRTSAPSDTVRSALASTISLATRALPFGEVSSDELSRIRSLIEQVGTVEVQLQLWARLGVRLCFADKAEAAKKVVTDYVEPILNQSYKENELLLDSLVAYAAPLLYLIHPASAMQAVARISAPNYKDYALTNICNVLFRRIPVGEPFDSQQPHEYQIDGPIVADVLSVLKEVKTDAAIMGVVEDLAASIGADRNKPKIPRSAAVNYLNSLEALAKNKLPDVRNIKHDGYLVASTAYIFRARYKASNTSVQKNEWTSLYSHARAIANDADRAVVTAMVGASAVASKGGGAIGNWVADIRADLSAIPSDQDRVDRHDWVARIIGTADKAACRALVSDALKLIVQLPETDDVVRRQRSLLDLAHSLDPKLADYLIDLNDTDEARRTRLKSENSKQVSCLEIARNPGGDEVCKMSDHELAEVCRDNLARLNAGRILPRSINDFKLFQARASKMPMGSASPVWHFLVESSLRKRRADKDHSFAGLVFDAACKAGEVVCGLIGKAFNSDARQGVPENGLVRNGDRDSFLERIRVWARGQEGQIVLVSDPYFGPEDVVLLHTIAAEAKSIKFFVLTSREHIRKQHLVDVPEAFEGAWSSISDEAMPEVTIVVIGYGNAGKHPIHDRWLVSNAGGLRLGTSAHSMGGIRTSEISAMTEDEARSACAEIGKYLSSPPREIAGERITIASYSM